MMEKTAKVCAVSSATGVQPIPLYLTYAAREDKYAASSLRTNTQASANLAYFQKVAGSITTPEALLKNYRALSVVLGAFGLQNQIGNTAILRQLLTQDPTASTSLARRLGNAKFQLFANALSNWTPPPFSTPGGINQIVSAFTTNTFETTAGTQAPGLKNALYFTREANSLKSVTAVQADQDLLKVVVTGLGLPLTNFEQLSFDQQTAILKDKLHLADLQNPATVKRFAEQYLVAQQSTAATGPASGSVASLFSDSADTSGSSLLDILNPSAGDGTDGTSSNTLSLFA